MDKRQFAGAMLMELCNQSHAFTLDKQDRKLMGVSIFSRGRVEKELFALKFFLLMWGISLVFKDERDKGHGICEELHFLVENQPKAVFQEIHISTQPEYMDHAIKQYSRYVEAVEMPRERMPEAFRKGFPASAIGLMFAELCGAPDNIFYVMHGTTRCASFIEAWLPEIKEFVREHGIEEDGNQRNV